MRGRIVRKAVRQLRAARLKKRVVARDIVRRSVLTCLAILLVATQLTFLNLFFGPSRKTQALYVVPIYAGTGVNNNDGGSTAWSNPSNATGDTTLTAATVNIGVSGGTSQQLRLTNFGFSLAGSPTIQGVTVEIENSAANSSRHRWNNVRLLVGGTETGTNQSDGSSFTTTKAFKTFGSSTNLWGTTLTGADVNASDFGVSLKIDRYGTATTTSIFRVRIRIDYLLDPFFDQSGYQWFNNQDSIAERQTYAQVIGGIYEDTIWASEIDSAGNVYAVGWYNSTGSTIGADQLLVKYNASGIIQWSKTWGAFADNEKAYELALDTAGNIYVVGSALSSGLTSGGLDQTLVKYNSSGVEQWSKTWGSTGSDVAISVKIDSSGNIYVAGYTDSSGLTNGSNDVTLVKYNSSGVEQWSKTWGGSGSDITWGMALDSSDNIFITGSYNGTDQLLIKYNSSGVVQWSKTWGGSGTEESYSIALDSSGNIYTVGYTNSTGLTAGGPDHTLVKYNSSGVVQWSKTWGVSGVGAAEYAQSLELDSSGNIYVVGYTGASARSLGGWDTTIIKYNSSGVIQWTRTWGTATGDEAGLSVSLDGSGNIIVVGESSVSGAYDLALLKLNQSGTIDNCSSCVSYTTTEVNRTVTATTLALTEVDRTMTEVNRTVTESNITFGRVRVYCGDKSNYLTALWGSTGEDYSYGLTRDSLGNIYTVGNTASTGLVVGGTDVTLVKYNSSGVEQWSKTWGGDLADAAVDIALDTSGNIYVVGNTNSTGFTAGLQDQLLIKFNSSGVLQWVKTWGGASDDYALAIAIDSSDNIYVTGYTNSTGLTAGGSDQTLIKYNTSGVLQWSKSWGGSSADIARGIALDNSGNIYVAGESLSFGASIDQTLVKYSSLGVVQWSNTWGGAGSDVARDVAVDSSGNVYVVGSTDSATLTSGSNDEMLLKYDSSGLLQWSNTWGTASSEIGYKISIDQFGNIYIAGGGGYDLLKLNADGYAQWYKNWLGGIYSLDIDSSGNLLLAGFIQSTNITTLNDQMFIVTSPESYDCNYACSTANIASTERFLSATNQSTAEINRTTTEVDRVTTETDRAMTEVIWHQPFSEIYLDVSSPLNSVSKNTSTFAPDTNLPFRLRLTMHVTNASSYAAANIFKLQYAQKSGTCDTSFVGESYADVSTTTPIGFYDNTNATDGMRLARNANDPQHGTDLYMQQEYQESGNFGLVNSYNIGQDGMWDIALKDNGAPPGTSYCFRVVTNTGSQLYAYSVIPEITTLPVQATQAAYRWFNNNDNPTFALTWGGSSDEVANDMAVDSSGNSYVVGYTYSTGLTSGGADQTLVKYNSSGVEQWSKTWGSSSDDVARGVTLDTSGNIYVVGDTASFGSGYEQTLVKYNSSGVEQWSKTWGGTGVDVARSVAVDASGNIYVTGYTQSTELVAGGADQTLVKYNSSGVVQWSTTWGGTGDETAFKLSLDTSGSIFVVGYTDSAALTLGSADQTLVKYNSSGVEQWSKTWGGTGFDLARSIAIDQSGSIFVVGYSASYSSGNYDQTLVKYDSSGVEQWSKTWGSSLNDIAVDISSDASNNLYVAGYTASTSISNGLVDQTLVKYDSTGVEQWSNTWGGTGDDYAYAMDKDAMGNIYVTGYSASTGITSALQDQTLLKFNSSGVIDNCSGCVDRAMTEVDRTVTENNLSSASVSRSVAAVDRIMIEINRRAAQVLVHGGSIGSYFNTWGGSGADQANNVATDSNGNVYIAGQTNSTGLTAGGVDGTLVKYNSSGVEQWSKTWGGTGDDYATAITIDSSDNIFIAGYTNTTGLTAGGNDQILIKFNQSGSTLWTVTWGGDGDDTATCLTTDSAGSVYIVGYTNSTGMTAGGYDQTLYKISSGGAGQWSKTWGGTGNDYAQSVSINASGNLYVAGYTNSTGYTTSVNDQSLVMYNSSGVEQWSKVWGSAANNDDYALGLALDDSGNIYVAGYYSTSTLSTIVQTLVKYNSSGVVQWSKSWGSGAASYATDVAVDATGDIYVAGYTSAFGLTSGGNDQTIAKYNSSGVEQWSKTLGGTSGDNLNAVTVDNSGNIYVTGYTGSANLTSGGDDQTLFKIDSNGASCSGICTDRTITETNLTVTEVDRAVSEVDRTTNDLGRTMTEVDRTMTEVRRNESTPGYDSYVGSAFSSVSQNTSITTTQADLAVRLYLGLHVTAKSALAGNATYKLQYSPRSGTCDVLFSGESYVDVTENTQLAYYPAVNFTNASRVVVKSGDITNSTFPIIAQGFVKQSGNFTNPNRMTSGRTYVWDFSLTPYETDNIPYCLRVVNFDGSLINSYTYIPEITVNAPSTRQQMRHGKYIDAQNPGVKKPFAW